MFFLFQAIGSGGGRFYCRNITKASFVGVRTGVQQSMRPNGYLSSPADPGEHLLSIFLPLRVTYVAMRLRGRPPGVPHDSLRATS
jgi:hypothetical protein